MKIGKIPFNPSCIAQFEVLVSTVVGAKNPAGGHSADKIVRAVMVAHGYDPDAEVFEFVTDASGLPIVIDGVPQTQKMIDVEGQPVRQYAHPAQALAGLEAEVERRIAADSTLRSAADKLYYCSPNRRGKKPKAVKQPTQ